MKKKSSKKKRRAKTKIIFRAVAHVRPLGLFDEPEEVNGHSGPTLMQEGETAQREHVAKMADGKSFGTSLLRLFNDELVDHVRQTGDNTYVPVFSPKLATHQLVGTAWHKDSQKRDIVDHGFAIAVVAKPLRPKLRQTTLVVKKAIPSTAPVYRQDGELRGKRGVILWLVQATKAKVHLRVIAKMSEADCDLTYQRIRRASLIKKLGD